MGQSARIAAFRAKLAVIARQQLKDENSSASKREKVAGVTKEEILYDPRALAGDRNCGWNRLVRYWSTSSWILFPLLIAFGTYSMTIKCLSCKRPLGYIGYGFWGGWTPEKCR